MQSDPEALFESKEFITFRIWLTEKGEKWKQFKGVLLTLILLVSVGANLDASLAPMLTKKSLKRFAIFFLSLMTVPYPLESYHLRRYTF